MEIEALIKKMKDIYSPLIDFIEATDDHDTEFKTLIDVLEKQEILKNKDEVRLLIQLILKLSDDHQRTSDFYDKMEKIFQYLIKDIPFPISDFIPDFTKYNKRILFLLLEKGFAKPDDTFLKNYFQIKPDNTKSKTNNKLFTLFNIKFKPDISHTFYYLYPQVKIFLEEKMQKQIEEEILEKYKENISTFEEKCQIGENDLHICSLIRSDSVEEFVAYVNRTNISLLTKITPSVYETNSFLIDKEPTLIEYAAFFGSIQIIQYLKYNNVPLTSSLWLYAIHSNNAELIHFLEENEVKPDNTNNKYTGKTINQFNWNYLGSNRNKEPFDDVLRESIKCHHNAISNYIAENFYEQTQADDLNQFYDNFSDIIFDSLNFFFFPNEIESIICKPKNNNGFELSQLCFSLAQITIPSVVTKIGSYAFSNCSSLTQIIIPSLLTSIEEGAFLECSLLTQITIPSSVASICDNIFNGCSSLTQITIPTSVNSIGNSAFKGCSSLTQVTIPSSVASIGHSAFNGCSSLTQITIPSAVTYIGNNTFKGCKSLTQISIPSAVTSIGNSAFKGCSSLTQIAIPSAVTSIGNSVFKGCSSLTQITIPSSVTSFGNHIFNGIKNLEITGSIKYIPNNLFRECSSLTQITIPSSVTSIGYNAFCGCSSLTQITIPSSVTSIGYNAFCGCSSLTQIAIPSSVTSIEEGVFCGCSSLTQIAIPSSVTSIGNNAFNGCSSLTQIIIPSFVTKIGNFAFRICSSLTQINIPSSITSIGNSTFYGCSSLKQVTIPSSVTSIGDNAFSNCVSLTQITIPSSVTYIGNFAFYGCSLLSAETKELINRINNSNTRMKNNRNVKIILKSNNNSPRSITNNDSNNNFSLMQKPHNKWNLSFNNNNKNMFSVGTNNDKKLMWGARNSNSKLEDNNNQKL